MNLGKLNNEELFKEMRLHEENIAALRGEKKLTQIQQEVLTNHYCHLENIREELMERNENHHNNGWVI